MNDEKIIVEKLEYEPSIESLKEEFKVVSNALKLEQDANRAQTARIMKLTTTVETLQKDLELERPRYGGDSTRKIARDAFNQSTTEANWDSLEDHPVIKNVYQALSNSRKDLGSRIHDTERRLDRAKPANEVFAALDTHEVITEIKGEIEDFHTNLQVLSNDVSNDRTHTNKQDLKLRDKIADVIAAQDALEFIQSETILKHDTAFMFLMGAWAKSGAEPVAEGLRIMLKKPKEEKKDHGITEKERSETSDC